MWFCTGKPSSQDPCGHLDTLQRPLPQLVNVLTTCNVAKPCVSLSPAWQIRDAMRSVAGCSCGAPTLEQLDGIERTLMLHEPQSQADVIGPGRALLLDMRHIGALGWCDDHPVPAQPDGVVGASSSSETAHVWLFPHVACYIRARAASQRQCELHGAQVMGRCAHWRRLELRGPRSSVILAALLRQEQRMETLDSRTEGAVLAGWLSDPRLDSGSELVGAACSRQQPPEGAPRTDVSALWTGAEPLTPPMTDQQVSEVTPRAGRHWLTVVLHVVLVSSSLLHACL